MKFFRFLFAEDGDKTPVPDLLQPSGQVSYEEGYGVEYELIQSDPDKRNIERRQHNQLLHDLTLNSRQYHANGFPEFITPAENGGVAYPYNFAACVRYNGHSGEGIYYSLVTANATNPSNPATWAFFNPIISPFRTGDVKRTDRIDLEPGFVWSNGTTIGNPDSGANGRANNDTQALFTLYWNTRPNAVLPIQNSDGTPGIRGANAAADWAANKRMPTPDRRGRVDIGHDQMGAPAPAGRMGNVAGAPNGLQIGSTGGTEGVQLGVEHLAKHRHATGYIQYGFNTNAVSGSFPTNLVRDGGAGAEAPTSETGGDVPHLNVQPGIIDNVMVKL